MAKNSKERIDIEQIASRVVPVSVKKFVHDNALVYAHYTISDRALISDDGLKPVNRRLLYHMFKEGAKGDKLYKAAMIASGVVGHLHPHGPSSVEGALAKMGQNFSLRVPLIKVQGSVGFVTGDKPAASRYWDAGLSKAGLELVKDVDNDTVTMVPNYSNTMNEPVQLPIRWPVGIINGTQGIAVGFASTMAPHNPDEVMDACVALLGGKIGNEKDLEQYIKGPDFPTGGELMGVDGVSDYLTTGSGTFTIRGKCRIEELSRGRHEIIFYELPYQVSSEQVITAIHKGKDNGKFKDISETKDLSGLKDGLKLSIYIKAGANPKMVLRDLWKLTPCESKFSVNSTVLIDGRPKQVGMIELLQQFADFKKECFVNGTQYKIGKLSKEASRLGGILAVLIDIDATIKIIRNSDTAEIASEALQKKFKVNEEQSAYILQMPLRSLTKSDSIKLKEKLSDLQSELERLTSILSDDDLLVKAIINELEETKAVISSERRTTIMEVTLEDLAKQDKAHSKLEKTLSKNVECLLTIFEDGSLVKTIEPVTDNIIPIEDVVSVKSLGNVFVLTSDGALIERQVEKIPINVKSSITTLGVAKEKFVALVTDDQLGVLTVTNFGNANITKGKLKKGNLITMIMSEEIIYAKTVTKDEYDTNNLFISAENGQAAVFKLGSVRRARQGSGNITGMRTNCAVDACLTLDEGVITTLTEYDIKTTNINEFKVTGRGSKGVILQRFNQKNDRLIKVAFNVLTVSNDKKKYKLPELTSRATKGEPKKRILYIGK